MNQQVALLTNACEYAGPGICAALAATHWTVVCSDPRFTDSGVCRAFEAQHPGAIATDASGHDLVNVTIERCGRLDALISNDLPRRAPPFMSGNLLEQFETFIDELLLEPVRLVRSALPSLLSARAGSIVFITSGTPLRNPPSGRTGHGYGAGRAGIHALVKSLAVELAPHNVQVNAVAPFMLYSETFFPSALGAQDPQYQEVLDRMVPMRRFGRPDELGALVHGLVSGDMSFVSGQVIAFSGAGC